jgi:hypothetical protein
LAKKEGNMAVVITRTAYPSGVSSSSNVATYSSVAIGDAAANRIVVVVVGCEVTSGTINSCTINYGSGATAMTAGTSATQGVVNARTFYLAVPTGTTATIAVTYGANPTNTQNRIAVYTVLGGVFSSAGGNNSTDMDATAPLTTGSTTIASGGGMIAVAVGASDSGAKTWANLTEDLDEDAGVFRLTTAKSTTAGTATRTCTGILNGEDGAMSWLIFTANVSPTVELNTPTDASSTSDTTPDLVFTGTDAESDDIRYNIQIDTSVNFDSQVATCDSYDFTNNNTYGYLDITGAALGQSFTGDGGTLSSANMSIFKVGSPTGNVVIKIYNHSGTYGTSSVPTGTPIATSDNVDASTLSTSSTGTSFNFSGSNKIILEDGVYYCLVITYDGDSTNKVAVSFDSTSPTHDGNKYYYYGGWYAQPTQDFGFFVFTTRPLLDKISGTDSGFSGSPDNTDPFSSAQAVTYTIQSALDLDTYYWRVKGIDPSGSNTYGSWSSTRSFTIYKEITTWAELDAIRNELTGNYRLMNDLDENSTGYDTYASSSANSGSGWLPLGDWQSEYFTGVFDGQGHTISGIYINRNNVTNEEGMGLFGDISSATIVNLGVINCDITVVGEWTGPLFGYDSGYSTIANCYSTGSVEGTIANVGGFCGTINDYTDVSESFSTCNVVSGGNFVGGFTPSADINATITNCYSTGSVEGSDSVGGFIGYNGEATIENCYSVGSVTGVTNSGGFCGQNEGVGSVGITNCYWDTQTSGEATSDGGTGKTTSEMKDITTFSAWDIEEQATHTTEVWHIIDGARYPRLSFQGYLYTIQKGLAYEVDAGTSTTAINKDLDYLVKTETAITKGLSYVVTGWYDTNWIYRVKITVDADQVDANLTDFPIYVDLSDLPAGFHTNVKSDGGDIRVTEDDGTTEVPREVVFYNSTTDTGELHFKGDISSTVDTDFYIYYGNSSASDYAIDGTYGAENVWKSAYKAVYHLGEAVNTTSGGYIDSTANDSDLTGVSMAMTEQAGQLPSKAQEFDGSADYLSGGDILDLGTNDLTISAWIKTTASPASQFIVSKALAAAQNYRFGIRTISTGKFSGFMQGDGGSDVIPSGTVTVNDGSFHLVHAVFDRSANLTLYTDSGDATSASISSWDGKDFQSTNPFRVGAYTANDNTSIFAPFDGIIDEVRIVWEALSSTWISTEYNNQSSPSTFFVIGSQEEISTTSSISISKDLAYKVQQSISITKSIAYRIKTDSSITKNLEYSIVDENTITKGLVYEVIVTTTETIQKDLDYSIVTDTAIQKGLEYQVITDVQIQRDVDYFIKTETALQKELDYAVRISDSVAKDLEYIIIITDSTNKDLDYTILTEGLIQKSMLYEVVVTGVEKVQATLDYTILTNIVAQKDLDYFIVTEGTIQKDLTYAVQPSTAITKDLTYTVESQQNITKDLDYHIVIPKLIQKDVTYFIKGSTGIQKDADYSVITTIDQDKALDYRVITEGDIQKDVDYYISITTNVEKDINYNLQVSTTIQKGVTYSIDVPSIIVQKDLDYAIVTTTSTTTDLDYNILLESTIQKDADYSVMGSTAITKGIEYTVIAPQSIEQALQYTIAITPSALEKALEYIIVQRTTKQYELRYRVDAPHSISKDLMYTIGEKIGIWIKHPAESSDSFTKDEGVSSTYTKTESVTASSYTREESVTPSIYTKTEKESSLWTKI